MFNETHITPLNFNDDIISRSWNDKKSGVAISLGFISGLPADLSDLTYSTGDIGLALSDQGIGQKELDIACQKLASSANKTAPLLVTKSDFPFDSRWYLLGDLISTLENAQKDRITLPFSNFLYDEILDNIKKYRR